MKMSSREWMLGMLTLAAALYGLLFYLGSAQMSDLQAIRQEQEQLRGSIRASQELVADRELWESKMTERQDLMPVFPAGERMDLHWLSVVEGVAARHQFRLQRHEPGQEQKAGPVFELPVHVRQWEGSIDALVRFLFDIEREGAMLDVRYLQIRPKDRTLRNGRLDIFCAYRRES